MGTWYPVGPGCLSRAMSESMAYHHPDSELVFVLPVITEGCADEWGLGNYLRPRRYPRNLYLGCKYYGELIKQ